MERLQELEKEITEMRKKMYERENELYELKKKWIPNSQVNSIQPQYQPQNCQYQEQDVNIFNKLHFGDKLPRWAIERYSRQILLSDIGVTGQEKICRARVLVVGAGGLGCPAASYLAGAGVGEIGIVDYDTVDVTNIHRQLLHSEQDQYMNKVESAANALRRINSRITITPYHLQLDSTNVLDILSKYDLVLDCTDNVPTRYLLNDSCVLLKIPLISGSALKMEGQLTIYVYRPNKYLYETDSTSSSGPCYRCLFPSPPPPETVGSCSAQGVIGPVPGVIGTLQALEAIKYIVGKTAKNLLVGRMLLFDGDDCTFRTVKLRPKSTSCAACSDSPTITQLLDYESFCRTTTKEKDIDLKILPKEHRTSPKELVVVLAGADKENSQSNFCKVRHLLVDVRSEPEFEMCRIEGAVNYPIDTLSDESRFNMLLEEIKNSGNRVTFVCRRGNDSQVVAKRVLDAAEEDSLEVKDLAGGLHAWSREVDDEFPIY